jgi:hypothetical protein
VSAGWIAAAGHIVETLEDWSTCYDWDGYLSPTRQQAICIGFKRFGSDDFNVGRVENGQLTWWGWMDEEHSAEDYPEVAAALGLDGPR